MRKMSPAKGEMAISLAARGRSLKIPPAAPGACRPATSAADPGRGEAAQADLAVIRGRAQLVEARTALVNAARGLAKPMGERLQRNATPIS
jgi:hypothetical protein